ncbi:YqkE family protein [Niallia sp. 01092]|uniref:YqkE family protein n=1 Tax=unclassified Niallia TaxID=2837522 RepID=UPI003FD54D01
MKKQRKPVTKNQQDKPTTLKDLLNDQLMKQLQDKKQALKAEEQVKQKAEEERMKEEKRLKEKNKSFEELLNENPLNWKEFK